MKKNVMDLQSATDDDLLKEIDIRGLIEFCNVERIRNKEFTMDLQSATDDDLLKEIDIRGLTDRSFTINTEDKKNGANTRHRF